MMPLLLGVQYCGEISVSDWVLEANRCILNSLKPRIFF
ncbi:MAG: Unknown protein [uncultured Thiotrichaceae bacterium]|uniref:Uncharacterized protein n=1 Tax=uncultured Thiotrichaceae bacterium TaxID=298394 RepID=A0A6S6UAZ9_9GAMM|nr:MAG: Unknown protein [uncultured Thiotrichaceae bacterium]